MSAPDYCAVLCELAAADGAILYWQVSDEPAFQRALSDNKISYDEATDCYLHLDAIAVEGGGFTMTKADVPALIAALRAAVAAAQPLPAPLGLPLTEHVDVWPQWVIDARAELAKVKS